MCQTGLTHASHLFVVGLRLYACCFTQSRGKKRYCKFDTKCTDTSRTSSLIWRCFKLLFLVHVFYPLDQTCFEKGSSFKLCHINTLWKHCCTDQAMLFYVRFIAFKRNRFYFPLGVATIIILLLFFVCFPGSLVFSTPPGQKTQNWR